MADHSKPTNTSFYTDYTTEIDARFDDITIGLDPALTTATNLPTGAIRWNSASNKWQKWSGSAWGELSSSFVFPSITSSSLTSGRVTFASTGGLLADNASFVWDNTNGRLGVNTASPPLRVSILSGVTTNNLSTPLVMLGSDRADRYASIDSVRGSVSSYIGMAFSTSNNAAPAEVMRIDPAGNLGIGTASPSVKLHISGANTLLSSTDGMSTTTDLNPLALEIVNTSTTTDTYNQIILETGSAHQAYIRAVRSAATFGADIAFLRRSGASSIAESMRIDASGNLMVGTTSALQSSQLTVYASPTPITTIDRTTNIGATVSCASSGTGYIQGGVRLGTEGNSGIYGYDDGTGAAQGIGIFTGNNTTIAERMRIDSSGNVGIGTTATEVPLIVNGVNGVSIASFGVTGRRYGIRNDGNLNFVNYTTDPNTVTTGMILNASGDLLLNRTTTIDSSQFALNTASATGVQQGIVLNNPFGFGAGVGTAASALTFTRMTGATYIPVASIQGWNTDETSSNRGHLTFSTQTTVAAGLVERMRIDSYGNVGVGTTDPTGGYAWNSTVRLIGISGDGTSSNASYGALNLDNNRATPGSADLFGIVGFTSSNSNAGHTLKAYIVGSADGAGGAAGGFGGKITFHTKGDNSGAAAQERMRITATGEVWIAGNTDRGAFNLQCNGTGVWGAGAYTNGSDERIKNNIEPLATGLDVVAKLNPVTYKYNEDWSKDQSTQTGFIAQELLAALDGKNYVDGIVNQSSEYMSVAYQNIIPILTKAIQEQQAMINELKAKVAALEAA